MMRRAEINDNKNILEILYKSIEKNIYLYIDILVYGIDTDFLKVWVHEKEGKIDQIVMKYYDSFQVHSYSESLDELIDLIKEHQPKMISGEYDTIKKIFKYLKYTYKHDHGIILEQKKTNTPFDVSIVQNATTDDMSEIARLICMDDGIGGHYGVENLRDQFVKRYSDKIGRNFIIKIEDQILGHYATYAETNDIAVLGGLIIHPVFRGKGYAKILHSYVSNLLVSEDKRVFLYCHDKNVLKMYEKLGAKIVSKYGKLTLL